MIARLPQVAIRSPDRLREPRTSPWLAPGILAAVALLGLGALVQPFTWDQAVFALGAERLLAGGRLYADYWDFKQPGIFWFFALAGRLFGMHELGVHLLELVWMVGLAVILQTATRGWLGNVASACSPLPVCGFYYTVARDWHLLQVEGLVLLPLTLSWAAAWRAEGSRRAELAWVAAGACGGVALLFKFALAPVLVAIWIVPAWGWIARSHEARPGRTARLVAALAMGGALPIVPALVTLGSGGGLALVWWTWLVYPAQVLGRLHGLPIRNLVATGRWLAGSWLPVLVPATLGAWRVLRSHGDRIGWSLLAWLASGIAVFMIQRWSGWEYQVFLVLVPLGLLATRGLEALAQAIARRWPGAATVRAIAAVLVLGAVATFAGALSRSVEAVRTGAIVDPAVRRALLAKRSRGAYDHYTKMTAFLQAPEAEPGPIYVLGNPLAYWMCGRPPAIAMPGGISIYAAPEWSLIARQLEAAKPPYILVEDPMAERLREKDAIDGPLRGLLERDYRPGARMGTGRWLVRRGS